MGGSTTLSQVDPVLGGLQVQTSLLGITIPWVRGRTRISGNLLAYYDFKAIPHTESQGGGGKGGGGVQQERTSWTYQAAVLMALCSGPINGVLSAWKGKERFSGAVVGSGIVGRQHTVTVPVGGAVTVPSAATFFRNAGVRATYSLGSGWDRFSGGMTNGVLIEGLDYTRSGGTYTFTPVFEGRQVVIDYQTQETGSYQSALQQLGLSLATGTLWQPVWSYLTDNHADEALGYSGLAYVYDSAYQLTSTASVDNHAFEVSTPSEFSGTIPDANMARVVQEFLTDGVSGALWPAAKLGDLTEYSSYCVSHGLFMSPSLTEQQPAAEILQRWLTLTNSDVTWSGNKLKIRPLGDESRTANGATYTANTTPVYDLTPDDFVRKDNEPRVRINPRSNEDAYNYVRVEFRNRANEYNIEVVQAYDLAHIELFGERRQEPIKAHEIHDPEVAKFVAQMELQRQMAVWNDYEFSLPWTKGRLEPLDLVTLTDDEQYLDRTPVRITRMEEAEDGSFNVQAEDAPMGHASAPLYGAQAGSGFVHDFNVDPGNAVPPTIFEAPVERTTTGLEVYLATTGLSPNWGGCRVWCSLDGDTYREVGYLIGGSRFGRLTGPVSGGVLPVVLNKGQLLSGTAGDAQALETLFYVGGASPEYAAYTTATLTGALAYNLSGLVRGAFSTSQAAHASNDAFVRIDDGVARSGPLDLSYIGKTISFKLTSFNVYRAAEQSLADVPAYSYQITGAMAAIPPTAPTGVSYSTEPFGIRLKCARNPEADVVGYEWRVGATPEAGTVLDALGGTSHLWEVQITGAFQAWVAAVDALGNRSPWTSLTGNVAGPSINSVSANVVGADLVLDYTSTPAAHAIDGYEISFGDTYDTSTKVGYFYVTRHTRRIDWGGARRWWVVARDVRGNYGAPQSADVNVTVPGPVTAYRSDVVDNNVLLYWGPPATGSLPIDRYEVRKGASYDTGTVVGSNGNSTFGVVFETEANTYNYWIAAFDSAGNQGTPQAITATVSQPPDYVLRSSINSTFGGTVGGMYVDPANGRLYGPNRNETVEQHFVNQGWTTIDNQIAAGYPLYFQPSANSGTYEEVFDYGTSLPATTITVTLGSTVLSGSVSVAVQIYYKLNSGDAWTAATAGAFSVLASNFRYVRVVWTFTASGGNDLIECSVFNVRLSVKQKTDSGSGTANAADSGGTTVNFNASFIDVESIVVTPLGTTARYAVYDFTDTPNPTSFKVLLFDNNGNRVSGTFSWTARGY